LHFGFGPRFEDSCFSSLFDCVILHDLCCLPKLNYFCLLLDQNGCR
jgi:hypothetical protein